MRTFTVTFHHTCNYGALLQAFALQHYIISLGHENTLFEYPYTVSKRKMISCSIRETIKICYLSILRKLRNKELSELEHSFRQFHEKRLRLSSPYESMRQLQNDPPSADCYITGSDQVWNLGTLPEFIPARFLDFGGSKVKRISYSASIEKMNYSDEEKAKVKAYLSKFDAISVREESARAYLESFTGYPLTRLADPVFLLSKEEWRNISAPPRINPPYILCYQVQSNENMQNVLNTLKKKTGFPVVSVCNSQIKWVKSDMTYFNVSPEEFLGLYDNASIVVSASFHGTAFGLLFGKPTYGLIKSRNGNRIKELLDLFRMSEFCISKDDAIPDPVIDETALSNQIEEERLRAKEFLRNCLDEY